MNKNTIKWTTTAAALTAFGLLAAPMASAVTVLTLEPLQFGQGPVIAKQLQGSMCSGDNVCKSVKYPASLSPTSIPTGAAALNMMINAESGPVIVFGYSEGAQVAGKWMQQYGTGPNAPDPSKVSFVLIGDPNRKYGGVDYQLAQKLHISIPTDTQYKVTDIARQYDFWADTPATLTDPFVKKNAIAGSMFVHTDYTQVNPNDPRNVKFTEGNITYVTVPNDVLPVYQLMAKAHQMTGDTGSAAADTANAESIYRQLGAQCGGATADEPPGGLTRREAEVLACIADAAAAELTKAGVPHTIQWAGSMFSIFLTEGPVTNYDQAKTTSSPAYAAFFHSMLDQGVHLPPSAYEAWFVSAAHDDAALDRVVEALPEAARAASESFATIAP